MNLKCLQQDKSIPAIDRKRKGHRDLAGKIPSSESVVGRLPHRLTSSLAR